MGDLSAEQIAQRAVHFNLLDDRQVQQVWGEFGRHDVSVDEFSRTLLGRGLLTNFQLERLLRGERNGYFYGDYKVLYIVSAGTFARVYRAAHRENGKIVALKVLRKQKSKEPKEVDLFLREGEMGRTLRHANIVPIHEVVAMPGSPYFVMEFVEGQNLREFLKVRKKVEAAQATTLAIDMAAGLDYAFRRGICHRDLKLTNVLVSSRGQARLIDFGLAGIDENVNEDNLDDVENPRTIDYAGLERATGVRNGEVRSDIYFAGCIFYHLLTGKSPLQETKDRIQRLSKQRFMDVQPIYRVEPDLPRVVSLAVGRAMELDADKRYQTPGEFLMDLKIAAAKMAEGKDIDAPPDGEAKDMAAGLTDEERARWANMLIPESQRRSLMFVESNPKMQDIFRDGLKRCGYRVLLTSDPDRALARFEDGQAADCVVFSSGDLGSQALEAFNRFGQEEKTRNIPAVLLLGERQASWKKRAQLSDHRVTVSMPIKLRQLRSVLTKLVPPAAADAEA